MNHDILGREINIGDFVVYTSSQIGLRVGLVLDPVMDSSVGSPYQRKRCSVIALDYRSKGGTLKTLSSPDTNRIIKCGCVPQEHRDILLNAAKERYGYTSDNL
jgi:hypothetical protein